MKDKEDGGRHGFQVRWEDKKLKIKKFSSESKAKRFESIMKEKGFNAKFFSFNLS